MARYNAGLIPASPTVVSGVTAFGTHVNPFLTAVLSGFAGTTRSDGVAAGHIWSKEVAGGYQPTLFVGSATDIPMGEINTADGLWRVPIDSIFDALINSGLGAQPGQAGIFYMQSAPPGWMKANGAAVSRTTYAALFAAIGTTWGNGNGSTTFNLPDMRGEFPRGWDDGRGVDSGRVFGSAQSNAVQTHNHDLEIRTDNGALVGNLPGEAGPQGVQGAGGTWDRATIYTARAADGNHAGNPIGPETRPRNIATLFCIKF